jgi:hypothetical protein
VRPGVVGNHMSVQITGKAEEDTDTEEMFKAVEGGE